MLQSSAVLSFLLYSATTIEQTLAASSFKVTGSGHHDGQGRTPEQELARAMQRAGGSGSARNVRKRQNSLAAAAGPGILGGSPVAQSQSPPPAPVLIVPTTLSTAIRPQTTQPDTPQKDVVATSAFKPSATDDLVEEASATKAASGGQWLGSIKVGSQKIEVPISFDTGSADTWFIADETAYKTNQDTHWRAIENGMLDITYGDETSARGHSGTTEVMLGDIVAKDQTIGLPTTSEDDVTPSMVQTMQRDGQWGYVGLGFAGTSQFFPKESKSLFETLMDTLEEPLFTVDIEDGAGGVYTFGQIDPNDHSGPVEWQPLNQSSWKINGRTHGGEDRWAVSSSAIHFRLGDGPVEQSTYDEEVTLFDTGTTLNLFDAAMVDRYYNSFIDRSASGGNKTVARKITSQELWAWPASYTPPALEIGFANTLVTMNNTFQTLTLDGEVLVVGGLQALAEDNLKQIVGAMWFKSAFAVFNGGNMSIGVAHKNS